MTEPNASEQTKQAPFSGLKAAELALADPLKEETRKARLYLLGVSMVGIAIVWTGLVPQEITTLGITFGEANRQALLLILALIVAYFLVAFVVYGTSDYIASRYTYLDAVWSGAVAEKRQLDEEERRADEKVRQTVGPVRTALTMALYELEKASNEEARARREIARYEEELENFTGYGEDKQKLRAELRDAEVQAQEAAESVERREQGVKEATEDSRLATQKEIGMRVFSRPSTAHLNVPLKEERAIEAARFIKRYSTLAPFVSLARRIFEFVPPIIVGVYAIYALLFS